MPEKPTYEELERKLLESDRLRKESNALFELSPDIIGIGNLDGFFIEVNSAFEKLTGYTKEELYERPFLSFIHEKDVEKTCNALDELQKGKQFLNMENRYKCKNGSYKWIEWYVSASIPENRFHAVGRDFTDRYILNTAMDGFCLVNHAGRFIKVNEAYCQMSGYSEQELLSMSIVDMEGLKTGEEATKQVEKILELGKDRFESLLRRKDGSLIDVELSVQYSERDGGCLIAFVRDITKQKKVRKEAPCVRIDVASIEN
ncbi:MAG: PAS domain-containing protein [Desulfobacter sp.]|nr:PAS domain-containing protein [Desulfobacter sp.]